jgi:hypothetical protein
VTQIDETAIESIQKIIIDYENVGVKVFLTNCNGIFNV